MLISTSKPFACGIPPVTRANGSISKVSKVAMMNRQAHPPPLQEKGKEKPVLQQSSRATSRREMMQLTAASIGFLSLLLPAAPAEARARNATMRQKILEKLEELRRIAGLSKPKDESEENKPKDETEGKSKVQSDTKEANPHPKHEGEEKKTKGGSEAKAKVEHDGKETKAEMKDEKNTFQEPKVAPVIPALPGIINGNSVETGLPL